MIVRSGTPTVTAIKHGVMCSRITIGSSDNVINQKSSVTNGPCISVAYIESSNKYKICKFTSVKRSQLIKCAAPREMLFVQLTCVTDWRTEQLLLQTSSCWGVSVVCCKGLLGENSLLL